MNTTTRVLPKKAAPQTQEPTIPNSLLFCALQVIHMHKNSLNALEKSAELDGYIAYRLTLQLVNRLTARAKNRLMSSREERVLQGSMDVELVSEAELENHAEYRAFTYILHSIIGDAPVMRLHLHAIEMVIAMTGTVRTQYRKRTVTEAVLQQCREEVYNYCPD